MLLNRQALLADKHTPLGTLPSSVIVKVRRKAGIADCAI